MASTFKAVNYQRCSDRDINSRSCRFSNGISPREPWPTRHAAYCYSSVNMRRDQSKSGTLRFSVKFDINGEMRDGKREREHFYIWRSKNNTITSRDLLSAPVTAKEIMFLFWRWSARTLTWIPRNIEAIDQRRYDKRRDENDEQQPNHRQMCGVRALLSSHLCLVSLCLRRA